MSNPRQKRLKSIRELHVLSSGRSLKWVAYPKQAWDPASKLYQTPKGSAVFADLLHSAM